MFCGHLSSVVTVQQGTPLHVLQELGGWSNNRMVQRYAHLAPEHLSHYADRLSPVSGVLDTFLATPANEQEASHEGDAASN